MEKVTKFTIDRNTWYRGQGASGSRLLTITRERCCLGFYSAACGIPDNELLNITSPLRLKRRHTFVPPQMNWLLAFKGFNLENSRLCERLMEMNDTHFLSEDSREEFVIKKFAEQGIEVEFIN